MISMGIRRCQILVTSSRQAVNGRRFSAWERTLLHCSSKQVAAKASRALRVSSGRSSLCSVHFSSEDRGFLRGEPIMETQQASQSTIFTNVQRVKPGIIALMPQPWKAWTLAVPNFTEDAGASGSCCCSCFSCRGARLITLADAW